MPAFEPTTPDPRPIGADNTPGELLYHAENRAALMELRGAGFVVAGDVSVDDLDATGTKDDTTYLRGDGTWSTPPGSVEGGVSDHGELTGLGDDDHTQYALADGSRGAFAAPTHTHVADDISNATLVGKAVITASSQTVARSAIGAGTSNLTLGTTGTTAMPGNKTFSKADVGLPLVNNTSDLGKPISTATQAALNLKSDEGHTHLASEITGEEGPFDLNLMPAGYVIKVVKAISDSFAAAGSLPTTRPGRSDHYVHYYSDTDPGDTISLDWDEWIKV